MIIWSGNTQKLQCIFSCKK